VLTVYNILTNIAYKEMFPVFSYVTVTGFFYCVFCALIRDAIVLKRYCVFCHIRAQFALKSYKRDSCVYDEGR